MNNYEKLLEIETFHQISPFFYDKNKLWWAWNKDDFCWEITDEINMLNSYLEITKNVSITKSNIRTETLNAMKQVGRKNIPKEAKTKYVQFKNQVFNLEDKKIYPIENRFFFTNPIPWNIGEKSDTPIMDKLFTDWVGKDNVKTLYEIMSYCCFREYPIQLLFCFTGNGRNGKTQFQKVLIKFLGLKNICSSSLDSLLGNRFESFKLYKKLACCMGETNFGILNKTDLLKKITGSDPIGFEKKNSDPFDEYNYAKILINSNSVPTSADETDAYFRRWLIIDFPNQFEGNVDIMKMIPEEEYSNLCRKVIDLLPGLIDRGEFTNQGSIEDRKRKYIESSNPLSIFIDSFCVRDVNVWVRDSEFYTEYCKFLTSKKKRIVSRKEFYDFLNAAGFERRRTSKPTGKLDGNGYDVREYGSYIEGIKIINSCNSCSIPYSLKNNKINTYEVESVAQVTRNENIYENKVPCTPSEEFRSLVRSQSLKFKEILPKKCFICGSSELLHMHHIRYVLPITEKDVVRLCSKHHIEEHQKIIKTDFYGEDRDNVIDNLDIKDKVIKYICYDNENNKERTINLFKKEVVDNMLSKGIIFESPVGTLRYV